MGWGGGGGGWGGGGGEEGGLLITNDVHFRESKLKHFIGRPPSAFDVVELFETNTSKTDTSKTRRKKKKDLSGRNSKRSRHDIMRVLTFYAESLSNFLWGKCYLEQSSSLV